MKEIRLMLSGKMRSGKTQTTQKLLEYAVDHGYKATRVSLAAPLKKLLKDGYHREDREALQFLGTEVMRKYASTYFGTDLVWVNLLIADIQRLELEGYNFFVCDDIRFPNELMELSKHSFLPIRLQTTKELQLSREHEGGKQTIGFEHESETALDKFENTAAFALEFQPNCTIDEIVVGITTKFVKG